ncbi:hypothetical protein DRI96_02380 [Candidatus Aerophobetes bacterium]|uniref:Amidohydrolase-related domain-containing protein n=1 Tax=Aerophobetes bacterium TaxID=2030807 RepID=A0A662DIT7_UNCAE|nr:MAG: hypothetical protein DRI96_02380 [Candidatus Aerophobetes bacterium]
MKIIDFHCGLGKDLEVGVDSNGIIRYMDKYGVNLAVISPLGKGFIHKFIEENQNIMNCVKENKEKFIGFCTVNPWFENCIEELKKRSLDGCKGIALNPTRQGFPINSSLIYPLIEECDHLNLPVYFYTGTSIYDLPLNLALLAKNFPKVSFIMGQMGTSDYWMDIEPALELANNLVVETSVNPNTQLIKTLVKKFGPERIIFGSGFPFTDPEYEIKKIQICNLSEKDKELIMFRNAAHLLKVKV